MYDATTTVRCPRCLSPLLDYCYHTGRVTGPRTTRTECLCCDYTREQTERAPETTGAEPRRVTD